MIVLIEAHGPEYANRGQTQGLLDMEVSAAPHLSYSVSVSSTQCDLDPRPAGTPQRC